MGTTKKKRTGNRPPQPPPPWRPPRKHQLVKTVGELCRTLGVSEGSVRRWLRTGVIRRRADGRIATKDVCGALEDREHAWEEWQAQRAGHGQPGELNPLQQARLRLLNLETRERARELVEVASVRESYLKLCEGVKDELMKLPLRTAPSLEMITAAQAQECLNRDVAAMLERLEALAGDILLMHPDPDDPSGGSSGE